MRKLILSVAAGIGILSTISAQLLCGSYDDFDARVSRVGAFHNAMMTNFKTIELPRLSGMSKAERIDYLANNARNFHQQFQQDYFPEPLPPVHVNDVFEHTKSFIDAEDFLIGIQTRGSGISVDDCLEQVERSKVMDNANTQLLRDLVSIVKEAQDNRESVEQQRGRLESLANVWLTANEGKTGNGKEWTGSIIAVGLKSIEWWSSNPDAVSLLRDMDPGKEDLVSGPCESSYRSPDDGYILALAWLDAGGALLSGGFSLFNQLVNGEVNWNSVGRSTVGGAAFASAGWAARIGKWLKNLF